MQTKQNGGDETTFSTLFQTLTLSQQSLLKRENNNGCFGANHNSMTRKNTHYNHIITYKRRLPTDNGKGWFNTHLQKWGRNWDQLKYEDQFEISKPKRGPTEYFNHFF